MPHFNAITLGQEEIREKSKMLVPRGVAKYDLVCMREI